MKNKKIKKKNQIISNKAITKTYILKLWWENFFTLKINWLILSQNFSIKVLSFFFIYAILIAFTQNCIILGENRVLIISYFIVVPITYFIINPSDKKIIYKMGFPVSINKQQFFRNTKYFIFSLNNKSVRT